MGPHPAPKHGVCHYIKFIFPFCPIKGPFPGGCVALTLLARFGVLDVRHRLGAQGPHRDSQLAERQGAVLVLFVD